MYSYLSTLYMYVHVSHVSKVCILLLVLLQVLLLIGIAVHVYACISLGLVSHSALSCLGDSSQTRSGVRRFESCPRQLSVFFP